MTSVIRTTNPEDGSTTIAAHIDVADLVRADRDTIDAFEIAMHEALEVISGEPDGKVKRLRWLRAGRNLWRALRAFLVLLVLICVVVAMARLLLLAATAVWGAV